MGNALGDPLRRGCAETPSRNQRGTIACFDRGGSDPSASGSVEEEVVLGVADDALGGANVVSFKTWPAPARRVGDFGRSSILAGAFRARRRSLRRECSGVRQFLRAVFPE